MRLLNQIWTLLFSLSAALIAALACATAANASAVKPDETVLFLSGLGWQQAEGWTLEVHGWIYESKYHKPLTSLFRKAIGIRDDELTPAEQAIFKDRAQFFLVDNERHKSVRIRLGEMTFDLPNSTPNGHFQKDLCIATEDAERFGLATMLSNGLARFELDLPNPRVHPAYGTVEILPATGVSVISDIDDTIKISSVRDHHELLRNTFCRPYKAVPGMAELYGHWQKELGAHFHYVSASPWQLYVPLSDFLHTNNFPDGTFHLKTFRLKDHTALDLFKSPEQYKMSVIEPLLKQFPNRQFILVGDSGERDPETYGALARLYPNQIRAIFIRDVTSESSASARYRDAFSGVTRNRWSVFKNPTEIVDVQRMN